MIIASINAWTIGSTGHIMCDVSDVAKQHGHETYLFSKAWIGQNYSKLANHKVIGDYLINRIHIKLAYYTGFHGCFSIYPTLKMIRQLKIINPDLIHLHNLHGWYLNLPMLFRYIKKNNIRVVWTLHDCWSFTGHCPYFDIIQCNKWKTGCYDCPQYREYPKSMVDRSRTMYKLKKKWFTGVNNMIIVTPSQWLSDLIKLSYLKDYQVKVINNGIDLSVFKPTPSDFHAKYRCKDKYILLGVAFDWGKRKGLDIFVELSKRLDTKYQIVLVGTDVAIDMQLPENIISIHRTQNQTELAEIYTAADLFVNPTREEVFGLVNVEALACGTPVITFNTGGSPECIDKTCGIVVSDNTIDTLIFDIEKAKKDKFSSKACIKHAKMFDMKDKFNEYLKLYDSFRCNL